VLAPRPVSPELERLYLELWLAGAHDLFGQDSPAATSLLGGETPQALAARLIQGSRLADPAVRRALWRGGLEAVKASDDPMIRFVLATDPLSRAARNVWDDDVYAPTTAAYAPTYAAYTAPPAANTGYPPNAVITSYFDPRYCGDGAVSIVTDQYGNLINVCTSSGARIYPYGYPSYGYPYGYTNGYYVNGSYPYGCPVGNYSCLAARGVYTP